MAKKSLSLQVSNSRSAAIREKSISSSFSLSVFSTSLCFPDASNAMVFTNGKIKNLLSLKRNWSELKSVKIHPPKSGEFLVEYENKKNDSFLCKDILNVFTDKKKAELELGLRKLFNLSDNLTLNDILSKRKIYIHLEKPQPEKPQIQKYCRFLTKSNLCRKFEIHEGSKKLMGTQIPGMNGLIVSNDLCEGGDLKFKSDEISDMQFKYAVPKKIDQKLNEFETFLRSLPLDWEDGVHFVHCYLHLEDEEMRSMLDKEYNFYIRGGLLGFNWKSEDFKGSGFVEGRFVYVKWKKDDGHEGKFTLECSKDMVANRSKFQSFSRQGLYKSLLSEFEENTVLWIKELDGEQQEIEKKELGGAVRMQRGQHFVTLEYQNGEIFVADSQCFKRLKSKPSKIYFLVGLNGNNLMEEVSKALEFQKQSTESERHLQSTKSDDIENKPNCPNFKPKDKIPEKEKDIPEKEKDIPEKEKDTTRRSTDTSSNENFVKFVGFLCVSVAALTSLYYLQGPNHPRRKAQRKSRKHSRKRK
eukprot:GHVP01039800.1.p1 GENE.GHVP01039800.1~~GHVP01039800.1.p1  ORF type:complete len:527 (-),score=109.39 GHVP01039800.1:59-1639(-)